MKQPSCSRVGALLIFCVSLFTASSGAAATLTVNSLGDGWDGSCSPSHCTLREAISLASSGGDTINFDFSSVTLPIGGPVIQLAVALPPISDDDLTIDGYDCTGCGPVSENTNDPANGLNMQVGPTIDGQNLFSSDALLRVEGDDVTLRGLNLINGPGAGIQLTDWWSDGLHVEGCIIGLERDGFSPAGNAGGGIYITQGDGNVIGPYNVISGNAGNGIEVLGNAPDDGEIMGNLIGTDISGWWPVGNSANGIALLGTSQASWSNSAQRGWLIGSTLSGEQNIISGNGAAGIFMDRRSYDNEVVGNVIGLSSDQLFPLGNGSSGVHLEGASGSSNFPQGTLFEDNVISGNGGNGIYCHACSDHTLIGNLIGTNESGDPLLGNTGNGVELYGGFYHATADWEIGSSDPLDANIIANNGGDGLLLRVGSGGQECRNNSIFVNEFSDNSGLAIDLEGDGSGDGPAVPGTSPCSNTPSLGNRGAARPAIDTAYINSVQLIVTGTGCPNSTVYVFLAAADPTGYGEPSLYQGSVSLGGSSSWTFNQATVGIIVPGDLITAYAMDGDGETGEAAENVVVAECDSDADGYAAIACGGSDCDDTNPAVNPGASEVCDALDTDCDGVIPGDEVDADGDGFMVCEGDCDDSEASVNPGAVELCDGFDTNCDGLTSTTEVDGDGDGFMPCAGDCDDGDATMYPGAPEL